MRPFKLSEMVPRGLYPLDLVFSFQYDLVRHDFPFGTCVKALLIVGDTESDQKYQQTFYDNFNFAVLENSLKWRQMEPNQVSQYSTGSLSVAKVT